MKITVEYPDLKYVDRASTRQYYFIRQDDQIDDYERDGLNRPMVFRLEPHGTMPMKEIIQKFLFSLNRSDDEQEDRRVFADCWDTWATNYGKVRACNNYITGEIHGEDPKWTNLVCGRNVICGTEMISDGSIGIRKGEPVLKVETLNPDALPFGINPIGNEHLIHHCTIITDRKLEDKYYQVNPFPQRGGREGKPVLYGLMSRTPVYIEMWMLDKLTLGAKLPSPYHPAWDWS